MRLWNFSHKERCIAEILADRVKGAARLSPGLFTKLTNKLMGLDNLSLSAENFLVHRFQKVKIYREKDICFSSFYQITVEIVLFLTPETLLGDYRSIDSRNRCDKLVEVTDHQVGLRNILFYFLEEAQQIARKEEVFTLASSLTCHTLHKHICDSFEQRLDLFLTGK